MTGSAPREPRPAGGDEVCNNDQDSSSPGSAALWARCFTIDRVSGAFLVLVGLFVVWERRVLPLGTTHHPGPGYVPLLLAVLLILFGVILIVRGKGSRPLRSIGWAEAPHAFAILGCCLFITVFLETIGYRLSMVLALGFLFGVMERIKLWLTLLLTFSFSFGTFWLFDTLLRVPLPRGGWGF